MDYTAFVQRLQETLSVTEVPLTSATIAYLYKISSEQAAGFLERAASEGVLVKAAPKAGLLTYVDPRRDPGPVFETLPPASGTVPSFSVPTSIDVSFVPPANENLTAQVHSSDSRGNASSLSENPEERTRCPFCNEQILANSRKCRYCFEYLDPTLRSIYNRNRTPATQPARALVPSGQKTTALAPASATSTQAALLSFFMPGLGQMSTGQIAAGVLWMVFTCFGYVYFIVPGLILHTLCVINAYKQAQAQQPAGTAP